MSEPQSKPAIAPRDDWNSAAPAHVPPPSYWPAGLALASTLIRWGLVSSLILTGVGVVFFVVALSGWIGELRHERRRQASSPDRQPHG